MKYPSSPITQPQIKKIHTIKSVLGLNDDNYEALLLRFNVESSKELTRGKAAELIDTLVKMGSNSSSKNESMQVTPVQLIKGGAAYFDRTGKATDRQINYISSLWLQVSDKKTYSSLMWFIKRVTGKLYLHIESINVIETRKVINALKSWDISKQSKSSI